MEDLIYAGRLGKAHGLAGELKIFPEAGFEEDLLHMKFLVLEISNQKIPVFIESVRGKGFFIVKLEGYDKREDLATIEKKDFYFRKDLLLGEEEDYEPYEELVYAYLTGFEVRDERGELVGKILSVEEYPHQEMAVLDVGGHEVLMPVTENYILRVDEKSKVLVVDLPEGLLELGE